MSGWGRGTPFYHLASSGWLCLAPTAILLMGGQSRRGSWLGRALGSSAQQCKSEPFGSRGHKCSQSCRTDTDMHGLPEPGKPGAGSLVLAESVCSDCPHSGLSSLMLGSPSGRLAPWAGDGSSRFPAQGKESSSFRHIPGPVLMGQKACLALLQEPRLSVDLPGLGCSVGPSKTRWAEARKGGQILGSPNQVP